MERKITLEELNKVAEVEIVYRSNADLKITDRPQIKTSKDLYSMLRHYWNSDKIELVEEFKVIYLNHANRVLAIIPISSGTSNATIVESKLILVAAIKLAASSIVLAHNHPSGNVNPSQADIAMTKKIQTAAAFLDIRLLDHIILHTETYYSFADEWDL